MREDYLFTLDQPLSKVWIQVSFQVCFGHNVLNCATVIQHLHFNYFNLIIIATDITLLLNLHTLCSLHSSHTEASDTCCYDGAFKMLCCCFFLNLRVHVIIQSYKIYFL